MRYTDYFEYILSIPISVYCNIRLLPFRQACKLPILVRYNTRLISLGGDFVAREDSPRYGENWF